MKKTLVLVLIFGVLLQGCATVFKGSKSGVNFNSEPPGAEVMIGGMSKGSTPLFLQLPSNRDQMVELKKAGYRPETVYLKRETITGYVILDIVPGFLLAWIPIVVDAASGNWYSLQPAEVAVQLHPVSGGM